MQVALFLLLCKEDGCRDPEERGANLSMSIFLAVRSRQNDFCLTCDSDTASQTEMSWSGLVSRVEGRSAASLVPQIWKSRLCSMNSVASSLTLSSDESLQGKAEATRARFK